MKYTKKALIPIAEGKGKPDEVGERIRSARKACSADTQEDLGMYLGVNRRTVARWEQGLCKVPADILLKISELYDVSVLWLLGIDIEGEVTHEQKTK